MYSPDEIRNIRADLKGENMNYTHNVDNLDFAEDRWLDAAYEDKFDYEMSDYNDWANGDLGDNDDEDSLDIDEDYW